MKKFFILGCPRSGTTMVQQALNRHSQIVIPPETKFFFSFLGHSRARQLRHLERLDADLGIRLPRPAARVSSAEEGRAFYDEMARQYVGRLGNRGVAWFGEKTPEHTGRLPCVRGLFPDAKFVVLYRDGRDVALSLTKVPWMSPHLYVNFLVWLYYDRVVRDAKAAPSPDFLFVRYEDVVAAPRRELGQVLRFLGLPSEPAVAEGWGNREGIPEREYPWKGRALEKITTDRVGLFRRELSADQVGVLERLGAHALSPLGYELLTDGKRPLPRGFLLDLSLGLSKLVYRLPWHLLLKELLARWCQPPVRAVVPAPV
ncbi:MAG TPA: sulfotransferase [Gemmataceae bacterium]|nr:sulfotransferase [Gemmataceae bacterium]